MTNVIKLFKDKEETKDERLKRMFQELTKLLEDHQRKDK